MKEQISVLIVDDHRLFLDGVVNILGNLPDLHVIGAVEDSRDALRVIRQQQVDLLVSDITMPYLCGKELCRKVKEVSPETRTLIVSMHEDIYHITELLNSGVWGYLPKNAGKEELISAVRSIAGGENFYSDKIKDAVMKSMTVRNDHKHKVSDLRLTKREIEVIRLIASEHTSTQIAEKLFISLNTAETHRRNIFRKTNVKNMAGLIRFAIKNDIIE